MAIFIVFQFNQKTYILTIAGVRFNHIIGAATHRSGGGDAAIGRTAWTWCIGTT